MSVRYLGEKRSNILSGLHRAIVLRAFSLLARSGGVKEELTFTGGVAKNVAVVQLIREMVKRNYGEITLNVHPDSIFMVLGGVDQATNWSRVSEILDMYIGMVDLFLLIVDRDGKPGRRSALDGIETKARGVLRAGSHLLAENAWQEIEVWILAGMDLPTDWEWKEIRSEVQLEESYYTPFARMRGTVDEPGEGRRRLALEAASRYGRIRRLCPEDVGSLEGRIRALLTAGTF